MKQNKVLLLLGIVLLLLAVVMAFDSNLSELAPVLFVLGLGCFSWLLYRRTWRSSANAEPSQPTPMLAKLSTILGIAGLFGIGLGGLSLLDPALEEFAAAALLGALLLVFALLARIANGMFSKRVDAATGGLSIAVILLLLVALGVACLVIYLGYLLLNW